MNATRRFSHLTGLRLGPFVMVMAIASLFASISAEGGQLITAGFSDVRTTSIQVVGTGPSDGSGWDGSGDNGFRIAWEVVAVDDAWLSYTYTISGLEVNGVLTSLSKALSHLIIQVTSPDELSEGAAPFSFRNASHNITGGGPATYSSSIGNSNPGLDTPLYGIKVDTTGDPTQFTFSFETRKVPVWGSFYAKDGVVNPGQNEIYAMNRGLYEGNLRPSMDETDFSYWIATPDGQDYDGSGGEPIVPEPSTLVLAIGCIAPLAAIRVIRRRRQARANAA